MADIRTHLRELSPLLAFDSRLNIDSDITPSTFIKSLKTNFPNLNNLPLNIVNKDKFNDIDIAIIRRGIKLGIHLIKKFGFDKSSKILWVGNNTQSDMPIDLIIDDVKFSLKEESFILENMGLYKFINLITGSENNRGGYHIFSDFAPKEYNNWFNFSWNYLINTTTNWSYNSKKYESKIRIDEQKVQFSYNNLVTELPVVSNIGIEKYLESTSSMIREKVFSKWLKEKLEKHPTYQKYKKFCSVKAGENLVKFLRKNQDFDNNNILRLLQIYDQEYYYAKALDDKQLLFRVPSKLEYRESIKIKHIDYSVPKSQLNIITTIENLKTLGTLILRNEVRFSHGQFNGTPEAKMYYDNSSDLSVIYFPF